MRYIVVIVFLGLIVSCKKENTNHDNGVVLTLLNDSLTYQDSHNMYNDIIENENDINIIRYKITNNSNDRLLFLTRSTQMLGVVPLTFDIESNQKPVKGHFGIKEMDCESDHIKQFELYSKMVNKSLDSKDIYFFMNYEAQRIVISPGESWEFCTTAKLPVMSIGHAIYSYDLKKDSTYTVALTYSVNKLGFDGELPDFEKENLKRNNIKIFNGELVSNRVKLVHVD